MTEQPPVCVTICPTHTEATIVKGLLEANGIQSALVAQNDMLPGTGSAGQSGVAIIVRAQDAPVALDLLGESTDIDESVNQDLATSDTINSEGYVPAKFATRFDLTDYVDQALQNQEDPDEIVKAIITEEWDEAWARQFVEQRAQQAAYVFSEALSPDAQTHIEQMKWGALWFIAGLLLSLGMFDKVSKTGVLYFVWWGATIFGLVTFIAGLIGWSKNH